VNGLKKSPYPKLYIKTKGNDNIVIVVLYDENLTITSNNTKMTEELKGELHKAFKMTFLGPLHFRKYGKWMKTCPCPKLSMHMRH